MATPASALAKLTSGQTLTAEEKGLLGLGPVVNATTIGMDQFEQKKLDIDFDSITSSMVVCDVIVNPPNTHLLSQAKNQGAQTIDGLEC